MSGGIYDTYHTELVLNVTSNRPVVDPRSVSYKSRLCRSHGKINSVVPSLNEFYFILRCAIKSKNLIGCFSINVSCCLHFRLRIGQSLRVRISLRQTRFTAKYGVICSHQYNVSDVFIAKGKKYVKVHNPHNVPDKLKT